MPGPGRLHGGDQLPPVFREECWLFCSADCGHCQLGAEVYGRGFLVPHTHIPPVPVHSHDEFTPGWSPGPHQAVPFAEPRRRCAPKKQRSLEVDGGSVTVLGRRGVYRRWHQYTGDMICPISALAEYVLNTINPGLDSWI